MWRAAACVTVGIVLAAWATAPVAGPASLVVAGGLADALRFAGCGVGVGVGGWFLMRALPTARRGPVLPPPPPVYRQLEQSTIDGEWREVGED